MNFKKYPSIENSYQEKFINKVLCDIPALEICRYILQEKIHGSNFQVCISKDGSIRYGKRSSFLEETTSFYGYQEVVHNMISVFEKIRNNTVLPYNNSITLYGELFGSNIQKGVNYGKEKRILFYDVSVDEQLQPPILLQHLFSNTGLEECLVPTIDIVRGLKNAVEYNVEFDSKILGIKDNICEGVVIKPYNNVWFWGKNLFYLKKKNDRFMEKQKQKKNKQEFSNTVMGLNRQFIGYCNENRINSVFSKEGPIQDVKDIGKYIKLVQEDAKEDFMKDHGSKLDVITDKKQLNRIFNAGHYIVKYLRKYV